MFGLAASFNMKDFFLSISKPKFLLLGSELPLLGRRHYGISYSIFDIKMSSVLMIAFTSIQVLFY